MTLPNRTGAVTTATEQSAPSPAADLGSLTLSPGPETAPSVSESQTLGNKAVLEEGALRSNPDLIEATRQEQANGNSHAHHHRHTISQEISEEHRVLQRAGFEGSQGLGQTTINQTTTASTGTTQQGTASAQLHDHILSLALSGTKKKEAVTDDAELAEFIRQHPELTQYIRQLQEARDTALKKAQESKQTGLESAANLNAKLDVIATLLEGSPIAPSLRMGDTVAKEAFIQESKKAFEDPDEGAALAEYVWNQAQEKARDAEQKRNELISAGEKQLDGRIDTNELAKAAALITDKPAEAAQTVRELRNAMEKAGVNMNAALDPATAEGMALAKLIEQHSPSPQAARQLTVMLLAAQLRADTHETSAKLPSEQMVDRYLALNAADKKLVDTYFQTISQKSADRYLFEAYSGIRGYKREQSSTVLERQPVENREAIIAKIVLERAKTEGMEFKFRDGQPMDDGIFRKTVEKIFDTNFGARPSQHEICQQMPGGIKALDAFDYRMRVEAAKSGLESLAAQNLELTGPGLAAHRAEVLSSILPTALATDRHTNLNLAPQFVAALEALPADERRELAVAYQAKTGMTIEQAARSYASASVVEPTLNSLSVLMAADSATVTELLKSEEIEKKAGDLATSLKTEDPTQLSFAARELHDSLSEQGISVSRALDGSLDEGKAFDTLLREQLGDDALVRQAKAALFAVELERQAGPSVTTLPSQAMVGYFLNLPKEDKAVVEKYFKGINEGSAERYLFEAFSGARGFQPLNWEMTEKRADRQDKKQIIAALLLSSAEHRGQPIQLKDGQLADPNAAMNELRAMYAGEPKDKADYVLNQIVAQVAPGEQLNQICTQGLLIKELQALDNGASQKPAAEIDRDNAAILAGNLKHMLATDPNTGGSLATPLVALLGQLPPERRLGLRDEYQKQTGRDLIADIRAGMNDQDPARVDYICGNAAMVLGRDDYERSAGFIAQSLAANGKLTPQTFADLMRGLDANGCLEGNPQSVERLNNTIAAYEKISGNGETFEKLLQRNEIPVALIDALRKGDRSVIDACLLRATLKGSENPIQEMHQLLGGEFNLNSRPELAAAYEKTFGEKFGDVREAVVLAAAAEYRENVAIHRRAVDNLRKAGQNELQEFQNKDTGGIVGFFYIWDGAYETEAKDIARRAEDNLKFTVVYSEKSARMKQVDAWTQEGSNLLKQSAELQSQGDLQKAAELDRQATVLFTKAQCRLLDIPYPTDTFEARTEAAQTLAREHAELVRMNASAADIAVKEKEARVAFEALITGPWSPSQSQLVSESIKSVLEINPSLDPRKNPDADSRTLRLLSNERSTGYLDDVPASALELSKEERKAINEMPPGLQAQQERDLVAQKRYQFEIEREFARNGMRPMGQRNLALLELEYRYVHRKNMDEFQKDWAKVMDNFDRTEGQLKAVRTGVLVVGAMATGGAGLPYLLAITAGSHAIQGAGDVAYGNKTWGEAGKTFVNEGGKDLLNVAMAGGMASVMKGGQVANFLGRAAGNGVQASSFAGRTALVGRQLAVSGASGTAFGVSMEGTNLAWDVSMYQTGMSSREVTFDEMRNRMMTAGATGFLGGAIGGGSAMLRANIAGTGFGSSLGRGLVSVGEYGTAGGMAQFQLGWAADGSFGVHHQGFDVFSTVMAVGSTYVGNKAAAHHFPGSDPNQVRSFAMFQPEPGVYSTPGVKNFSIHAAELSPITDRVGAMMGMRDVAPIDKSSIGTQAAAISAEIAQVETALKLGFEMVEPNAPDASPLLLMASAGASPNKPALPTMDLPQLPAGGDSGGAIVLHTGSQPPPSAPPMGNGGPDTPPTPNSGPSGSTGQAPEAGSIANSGQPSSSGDNGSTGTSQNTSGSNTHQSSVSDGTALAVVENGPATAVADLPPDLSNATQKRFLSAEDRVQLEARLEQLRAEYKDGLAKAKLDKGDRIRGENADAKIAALDQTESPALQAARAEQVEIQNQLRNKGSDAVTGEARQRLEDRLRVLKEKTIPIEQEADALTKKYRPDPSKPDEFAKMNDAIREVAKLEALAKRGGMTENLTNDQLARLNAATKVLDDVKYTRKVNGKLQESLDTLDKKAEQQGWANERLTAERTLQQEKARLKIVERTMSEGPDKNLQRARIKEQLDTAKREVGLERDVGRLVKYFGAGTPEEVVAARKYLRVRQEFIAAGAKASPELSKQFNDAYQHHCAVREAAQTTAAVNAHNAKLDRKLNKSVDKIDASNNSEPLKSARREEAELNALLKSHRKEPEVVTRALDLVAQEIRAERAKTPAGQENPRIAELTQFQNKLSLWKEADQGSVRRGEGPYSQRTVGVEERRTFEAARDLVEARLERLRSTEIPQLKQIDVHTGGKKYASFPKVVEAAERLVAAEQRFGSSPLEAIPLDGGMPIAREHPEVQAARADLSEAKRLARTEISRVDRLARLTEQAAKHKWHSELVDAKAALIDCDAAVQRTKNLPAAHEQRELALANRKAAADKVTIEQSVFRRAIKNGFGSEQEVRLARELAQLERTTNFDPELGIADNPRYTETAARLNRLQAAHAGRQRDQAHNRSVDERIASRDRRIDAREELPELKDLRKQLQRAEAAYDRRGKERVGSAADAMLTEKIDDLKSRIPRAERVDELARRYGYSSKAEIEAARTIAALEQKMGIKNPTMDDIRLRLSPQEQGDLRLAWSRYQDAQTESMRVAFNAKVDRGTERRQTAIDDKPWIAERKNAAKEEIRLEGELKKLKGNSPATETLRQELRENLRAHREGALRDAERLDFLARTRGRGTEGEIKAAEKVVEAEKTVRAAKDSGDDTTAGKQATAEALDQLKFERNRVKVENKYVAKAIKAEWTRDYSAQSLVESVITPTTAIVVRSSAAASAGAIGTPDTPLEERVATFEAIFDRKLRAEEVEFLSFVPDHMYKEVVSRVQAGWTPNRPLAALPEGRPLLEGTAIDSPALTAAPEAPRRALPAAPERVIVNAGEPEPMIVRQASDESEAAPISVREDREISEMFARNLERELERGRDSRGNPIDPARTRDNLIAQKERISELLNQEIQQQRRMIEIGNEAARRGELPGGIKVDPQTIKQTQRELFQEIEALDRAAERVRGDLQSLRRQQRGSSDDTNFARRRSDDNDGSSSYRESDLDFEPVRDFSSDGEDNWWRNGGSAPEYRPEPPRGGGFGTATRTAAAAPRERVTFAPVENDSAVGILEPRNQGTTSASASARRGFNPMNEREIDNFMLGVDDLDGSPLDAVLGHIDQAEGRAPAARPTPMRSAPDSYSSRPAAAPRRSIFDEREPIFQPQRQAAPEPAPRVQVDVATETRPFDFNFEVPAAATDTALAVFTPELTNRMAELSAEVDATTPTRAVAIQPYRQPATLTPEVVPHIVTRTETATSTSTGQLLGRLTKPVTTTEQDLETSPVVRPEPQTAPARARTQMEEATRTERRTERRREGGVGDSEPEELRRKEVHKKEEERKKHVREQARSEKKGGAKLRFSKIVDELGDEDLIVENEENTG